MPSDSSQRNSGTVAMPCATPPLSITSSTTARPEMQIRGPPISPNIAKPRGTSPEVYIRYPRINPFPMPTMKPGPRTNVQSRTARSVVASATSEPGSSPQPSGASHYREETDDADRDEGAFNEASCDISQSEGLVLAPEDRKDHHGRADVRNNEKDFAEHAQSHPRVTSSAGDEVRGVQHRVVEDPPRSRRQMSRGKGRRKSAPSS